MKFPFLCTIGLDTAIFDSPSEEAFFEDSVQVSVVEVDQFFKQAQRCQIFLELEPLIVDHLIQHVLFDQRDEVVHLLAQKLELSKANLVLCGKALQGKLGLKEDLHDTQGN